MANYNEVKGDIDVLERAVMDVSAKVGRFKEADKVRHQLGKIQAIIGENVKPLLLKG